MEVVDTLIKHSLDIAATSKLEWWTSKAFYLVSVCVQMFYLSQFDLISTFTLTSRILFGDYQWNFWQVSNGQTSIQGVIKSPLIELITAFIIHSPRWLFSELSRLDSGVAGSWKLKIQFCGRSEPNAESPMINSNSSLNSSRLVLAAEVCLFCLRHWQIFTIHYIDGKVARYL